jgi:hypothetical protein
MATFPPLELGVKSSRVCNHWTNGFCSFGQRCKFAHPPRTPGNALLLDELLNGHVTPAAAASPTAAAARENHHDAPVAATIPGFPRSRSASGCGTKATSPTDTGLSPDPPIRRHSQSPACLRLQALNEELRAERDRLLAQLEDLRAENAALKESLARESSIARAWGQRYLDCRAEVVTLTRERDRLKSRLREMDGLRGGR